MNLYRIMADVRAGAGHRSVANGEFGIVTIWVRASSMSAAFARAGLILEDRHYSSIGTLHCYAEKLVHDPLGCSEADWALERAEEQLLAGYDALRDSALTRADGLHEIWLGDAGHQVVGKPGQTMAA
jgi:hypothetical protein